MSFALFWLYSISPRCDLKQTVFISLFTRSQPCLGELLFCQHPLSSCLLAKGTPAKKKASLSLVVMAERGSLPLCNSLCLQADIGVVRHGFNPFPVAHSSVLCFFSSLHELQHRVKPLRGRICEIPARSFSCGASLLPVHLLLRSWQQHFFCGSVVILAGMG